MDALEDVRGGDVVHVEGRVLAEQDHVHFRQVGAHRLAEREMVALLVAQLHRLDAREHLAVAQRQPVGRVVEQRVAAPLRLQRQREAGVAGDRDRRNMVHLHGDLERHECLRRVACLARACIASPPRCQSPSQARATGAGRPLATHDDRPTALAWPKRRRGGATSAPASSLRSIAAAMACIAGGVRVQMVALVELGLDVAGLRRIDHDLVEVDDAVELAAVADEFVDGEPDLLLLRRVVAVERRPGEGIAERRQRRADDAHAVGMGARDQLPVAGDDVLGGRLGIVQGQAGARPADVVDAHHQDDRVGVRLAKHIALEAGERIGAHAVAQHLGARDALVEHGDRRAAGHRPAASARWSGQRSLPSTVEPSPSVMESPNSTMARASCRRIHQDRRQEHALRLLGVGLQRRHRRPCCRPR